MNDPLYRKPLFWQLLAVGLLVPAFFSHLGLIPLDTVSDEPRRALVAIEMMLSGDYLTPTLNGEPYFNKPPLYNWIIAASYHFFGDYSAFALRFPMAVSLVLYGLTVFLLVRRHLGSPVAFAAALMLVTNARVMLYDSLLGLIDITFSWLTYTAFIWVYQFDRQRRYYALFLSTYVLTALGFLMKGLPSLVFQGLTLLAYFLYTRQFRRLFHPAHFLGIGVFLLIVGSYYVAYFTRNAIPLSQVAGVLFSESAKRTVVEFGIGQTLLHMLTFPLEMLYHYAPWLVMVVFLFRRLQTPYLRDMAYWKEPFVRFNGIIFLVNFVIYWTSPQVYARYLLMLLPLLFTILAYGYYQARPTDWRRRFFDGFGLMLLGVLTLGSWAPLFIPETKSMEGLIWKCGLFFLLLAFFLLQYQRQRENRLLILFATMAVLRWGFNWFALPPRVEHRQFYKDSSEAVARLTLDQNGKPLPLYGYKATIGTDGGTDVNSFHIAAVRRRVLGVTDRKIPGAFYIADSLNLAGERYRTRHRFMLFDQHPAYLVQFE